MTTPVLETTPVVAAGEPPLAAPLTAAEWRERPLVRFAATFAANVARAGLSFVTGLVVARGLGPASYGDFTFLLASFTALNAVLDAGSTPAFYTLLSGRKRGRKFFAVAFAWRLLIQFGVTALAVGLLAPPRALEWIWLGHDRSTILLAFVASFMIGQVWNAVSQMGEAARRTVTVQIGATVQAVAHLVLVVVAMSTGWLEVRVLIVLLIAEYLVISFVLAPRLLALNLDRDADERYGDIVAEFLRYCRPLILYAFISFLYQFADRWLLQRFAGSAQQGYFSIGQQFATVSLLATTSILNVFWKEIAAAHEAENAERVRTIYARVKNSLFFCAAGISALLMPYSREILRWTLGAAYEPAWPVLMLLFFYPVHQSLGHIGSVLCLATKRTDYYSLLGITSMLVSLPVTWFMLASPSAAVPGLGLGAIGLAAKLVGLQILGIAFQMYLLRKAYGIPYDFGYQAGVIALLTGSSFGAKAIAQLAAADARVVAAAGALLFLAFGLMLVVRVPQLAGLTPAHVAGATRRILSIASRPR